jgi:hypothetical protein
MKIFLDNNSPIAQVIDNQVLAPAGLPGVRKSLVVNELRKLTF